jgi:hypothetical protein
MISNFSQKESTILCEIMGRNKSDKGHLDINKSWHNYTTYYHSIFEKNRFNKLRLFELGLGTNKTNIPCNMGKDGRPCASLYGWSEYFLNSEIFGADIDKDILINNEKFKTFYCDQTNSETIKQLWKNKDLLENFDIIIDDGFHNFNANVCFFENSIHKLNINGYYIIEDICIPNLNFFIEKIKLWKNNFKNFEFNLISLESQTNNWDNNLLVVKRLF